MSTSLLQLKRDIIEIGHRLWERGYVAANDGNISIRLNENEILTTPTGVSKGFINGKMLIRVDLEGNPLDRKNKYRPSSELQLHLKVYQQRKDAGSVIHAHPPYCTSFAVAGIPLDKNILPEAVVTLGVVPIAPYGTPSSPEIQDSISPFIQNTDVLLLANHGALVLGTDVFAAYHKMETLEHTAQITFLSLQLGNINVLQPEEVEKLMELRSRLKIPGKIMSLKTGQQN